VTPQFIRNEWLICPSGAYNFDTQMCTQRHPVFRMAVYQVPEQLSFLGAILPIDKGAISLFPFQFHAVIFALFASLIAPFGGFLASGIKRAYQIKDYASLFPGHGGFMDRVDCQFMMASFVFVYLITFINPTQVSSVFGQIKDMPYVDQQALFLQLSNHVQQTPVA